MPRGAVALNLVKAWLLVALLAGAVRRPRLAHRRDARRRCCSRSARSSPRPACTATATARSSGCSARGRSRSRRIPFLRSAADTIAAKLGVRPPQLYLIDDGFPRLFVGRPRPVELDARRLDRRAPVAAPRGARGGDRARARARPAARRARADVRRALRGDARRDRAGSAAGSRASCSTSSRRSAPRSSTSCSRRSASCTRTRSRRARPGAAHDLADALMRLDRAAELVDFAASPATEPLYPIDPFEREGVARMFKTHPPLDGRVRRLRELGAGSNGRVPSVSLEARRVAARTSPSRGCARPGWRRCARRTPSRRKPTFSATRCDATLSGSVIEVEALELEIVERLTRRAAGARACRRPGRVRRAPPSSRSSLGSRASSDLIPIAADDVAVERDRERVLGSGRTSPRMNASASSSVYGGGISGIQRAISGSLQPATIAGDVVLRPRPQHEIAVAELHSEQSTNDVDASRATCTACGRDSGRLAGRRLRDQEARELAGFRSAKRLGGVLLSRGLAPRVPSALAGLTSLFGMGRGVSPPL